MAGLPWIPLDVDFPTGRKAVALGVALENPMAWAHVVRLWTEAARKAADGRIEGPAAVQTIELWAGWNGSPGAFVEACSLAHVALLDVTERGFYIHDWHEHCGAHVEKREKDRDRMRRARSAKRTRTVREPSANVRREREREREKKTERETDTQKHEAAAPVPVLLPSVPPKPVSPLVAFLRQSFPDISDPWACEEAWSKAFPAVDLLAEALKAQAWETADPKRKKTNHGRFLNSWFARSQDGASTRGRDPPRTVTAPAAPQSAFVGGRREL